MNYEEFLEKLENMPPVEAAIYSAMYVAQDIGGLERCVRNPENLSNPNAIALFGNRLADDMDRLWGYLGDDASDTLAGANPYPAKLGRHTESSFAEATWYVGTDWLSMIDSHIPTDPLTIGAVADSLPGLLDGMRSLSDVTGKEMRIQLEKEFRRATGERALGVSVMPDWVDDGDVEILLELKEFAPTLLSFECIANNTEICQRTVQARMPRLEKCGYVARPAGDRKGWTITDSGREILKAGERAVERAEAAR